MKKYAFLLLMAFLVLGCSNSKANVAPVETKVEAKQKKVAGKVEKIFIESKIMGYKMPVNIYTPTDFDKTKPYPVLFMLHGAEQNENQWTLSGLEKNMNEYLEKESLKPFIIVMPYGEESYFTGKVEKYIIQELVPYIESNYGTKRDVKKTAVAGTLMGGYGAFNITLNNQDIFGESISVAGVFNYSNYLTFLGQYLKSNKLKFKPVLYIGEKDFMGVQLHQSLTKIFDDNGVVYSINKFNGGKNLPDIDALTFTILKTANDFFYENQ